MLRGDVILRLCHVLPSSAARGRVRLLLLCRGDGDPRLFIGGRRHAAVVDNRKVDSITFLRPDNRSRVRREKKKKRKKKKEKIGKGRKRKEIEDGKEEREKRKPGRAPDEEEKKDEEGFEEKGSQNLASPGARIPLGRATDASAGQTPGSHCPASACS